MEVPSETEAEERVEELLREWVEERVQVRRQTEEKSRLRADYVIQFRGETLIGEYKRSSDVASVAQAIEQVKETVQGSGDEPLLVVPYMGEKGAERCRKEGVGWMDLSGNADLSTDSFLVHVEGKPNQFKQKGRPSNPFAPKSSRISRFLLTHPNRRFRQKEIAERTGVGRGWTSKVVRRLEEKGLVTRVEDGRIEVPDPSLLLSAWHEKYDFSKHRVLKGTIASKDSVDLTKGLAEMFESASLEYAATGLAAAWLLTEFARFRIVTFYLNRLPGEDMKRKIGLREDPAGANVWLVVPNDEGVFHGTSAEEQVRRVHPVQAYLDLKGHPERSEEAAESIKNKCFDWSESNG
jgi:hypothetical protein